MKRMIMIILTLSIFTFLTAPSFEACVILQGEVIKPYERIWEATCKIESSMNPLAYHLENNGSASVGIVQIQQSRLDDFKERTGIIFTLEDMYSPDKAKIVFMSYASEIKDYERIARCWNGGNSGMSKKSTLKYWNKIKAVL